jgi:hypothetical protein
MIIDTHFHIGKGEQLGDPYQVDKPYRLAVEQMAEAGVDKTCVMPVAYRDYEGALEEIREAVAAHPDKLIGYARVNLADEERALRQLRRSFEEYGFRGCKISTGGDGFPTRRFMDAMSEYQRPLLLHTYADLQFIEAAGQLARGYPKVPIILGHMGGFASGFWPGYVKLCAVEAQQVDNVYLDTALVFLHGWIEVAAEICGAEKIVFGSDGPVAHPAVALKQIELCGFSDQERNMILGGTARRLLGL